MKKSIIVFSFMSLISFFTLANSKETQAACKQSVIPLVSKIPGWCSTKKAGAMMDLIFEVKPAICVEIGVFAGASILPTATALKYLNKGIVFAIDSWNNHECVKYHPLDSPHREWWSTVDLNFMYNYFLNLIESHDLNKQCIVLRSSSEDAAPAIDNIDILHIDSTHMDESAFNDVTLYVPKVKKGGYIWFDGWNSTPNAFEYVKKTCQVTKVIDEGKCVLLEKILDD